MRTVIERRLITDQLLTWLADTSKPVGDAEAPDGGGWQGEVNQSNFVPYVVLSVLQATTQEGPINDYGADATFPYALTCYGVSRKQCEFMADAARAALTNRDVTSVVMDTHTQRINTVFVASYGGVNRMGQEPPYYACTDTVQVRTVKE